MQKYVVGFCFSQDKSHVVIMLKNRPDYQAGLHNGLGGKVENDELACEAMMREFKEETGVSVTMDHWKHHAVKTDNSTYYIDVYYAFTDLAYDCRTIEDEDVIIARVDELDQYKFFDDAKEIILAIHSK